MKRIVTENPNCVHVKDEQKWTLFDIAIEYGRLDMMQYLWDMGGRPNLDIYRDGKHTPVHMAADNTYIATLEWVFENKVLPLRVLNIKSKYELTPLDIAIRAGKLENAKLLWGEMGGRPNLKIYRNGEWTPVHWAALYGYTVTLTWVFKEKVLSLDVLNIKDCDGLTPLDVAISEKKWETAALLRRLQINLIFLAMHRAKRDFHQMCVLRRLPDELLDMVVDEVAARFNLVVVWSSL